MEKEEKNQKIIKENHQSRQKINLKVESNHL
jgi:hypothetical protein